MPRPVRIDGPGAIHHVVARGNERKAIFRDDEDRQDLLDRLARNQPRLGFQVYAFCLMGNHIHLAVRTGNEALSRVMLTVLSSYAGAFNRRHRRVGHLFQGRYKASLIKDERHLLAVVRYIHRNPVAARITARADLYPWSSDRFYRHGRAPAWLDTGTVREILECKPEFGIRAYATLIDDEESWQPAEAPPGDTDERKSSDAEELLPIPVLEGRPVDLFVRAVAERTSVPLDKLHSATRQRSITRARALIALLARDLARIPISRTAECLGRDESTLSRRVVLLEGELTENAALRRMLDQLRTDLINNAFLHG